MSASSGPEIEALRVKLAQIFPNLEISGNAVRGGMGIVFKAHQITLDRPAALKVLLPPSGSEEVDYGPFFAEGRSLAKLKVPGIVGIYDAGQTLSGIPYMLLEWMPGGTLRGLLAKGPLAPKLITRLAMSLAATLQQTHAKNIVHGDIKPDNIMLDEAGEPHLGDFGVASLIGKKAVYHTPEYAAPELLGKDPRLTPQTDFYALGVTLAELALGAMPKQDPEKLAHQLSRVQQPVRRLLLALLQPSPVTRPSQAEEIAKLLLGPPQVLAARPTPRKRPGAVPQLSARQVCLIAVGVLLLAAGAYVFFNPPPSKPPELDIQR